MVLCRRRNIPTGEAGLLNSLHSRTTVIPLQSAIQNLPSQKKSLTPCWKSPEYPSRLKRLLLDNRTNTGRKKRCCSDTPVGARSVGSPSAVCWQETAEVKRSEETRGCSRAAAILSNALEARSRTPKGREHQECKKLTLLKEIWENVLLVPFLG